MIGYVFIQIQLLLTEYLDMKNTEKSRQQVPSSFDEANMDIGAFFARKKPQKSKKVRIMSHHIRKSTTCIGRNKGIDQLCSNCTADKCFVLAP